MGFGVSLRVVGFAGVVGGIAFLAGFIGPLLVWPSNNLGPLLGIFITGPAGVFVGALLGVAWSARTAEKIDMKIVVWWILGIWVLSVLYTLLMFRFSTDSAFIGLIAQGLVVATAAYVFIGGHRRAVLPEKADGCLFVALAAMALIMIMTAFPPVTEPWWIPESARTKIDTSEPMPHFAMLLDERFDAGRTYPVFTTDRRVLVMEWVATILGALAVCQVMKWRRR